MFFLPVKNIVYVTPLSLEEVYLELSKNIKSYKWLRFELLEGNHSRYEGSITEKGFNLARISGWKNRLSLRGTFYPIGEGVKIKVTYIRWATFITLFFTQSIFLGILFILIKSGAFLPWFYLAILLLMLIFFIIPYRLFQYEVEMFEFFLEKKIGATKLRSTHDTRTA